MLCGWDISRGRGDFFRKQQEGVAGKSQARRTKDFPGTASYGRGGYWGTRTVLKPGAYSGRGMRGGRRTSAAADFEAWTRTAHDGRSDAQKFSRSLLLYIVKLKTFGRGTAA